MRIGKREFDTENHCYVMGILNVTPDSFSDGGRYNDLDRALYHAEEMVRDGADILDIGGESTRPGHRQISDAEEIGRIAPVLEALHQRFDVPLSIDTYKSRVAEAALQAGADMVNDIWGLKYDPRMAQIIASADAACCLMHNREKTQYESFLSDVLEDLKESVRLAKAADIREDGICLDPGIGFAKTYEMNLEMMKHLEIMNELKYPVLLGTSRKSMIGLALDLPSDQREEGTLATTVMGVMKGCSFVRVHDVKSNCRAVRMTEAILESHNV